MSKVTDLYGSMVFNEHVMRERLPKTTYKQLMKTIKEGAPLNEDVANVVAHAMKEWAIANSPLAGRLVPLTVRNDYFGGNVNVTGLLTAQDIAPAIKAASEEEKNSTMVEQGADARCSDRASSADGIEGATRRGVLSCSKLA